MNAEPFHEALLDNHVKFLAGQRGTLRIRPGYRFIDSDRRDFRIAIVESDGVNEAGIREAEIIFLPPWLRVEPGSRVSPFFGRSYQLRHMSAGASTIAASAPTEWHSSESVERADNPSRMSDFTHVQVAAFSSSAGEYAEWFDWMLSVNLRAMRLPGHKFWLRRERDGAAVSCIISVETHDLMGLYGVGTLAEKRRSGHSTQLMQFIANEAVKSQIPTIALQVVVSSYAEKFYENLGFESIFVVNCLRHAIASEANNR
jgi:N-acetylglutamate synthase-like GNAT family acetyltransferase